MGLALAAAAGLAAYPALAADRLALIPAALGAASVVLLAAAFVTRWPAPVAWSLALLGGEYGAWLALRGDAVDTRAPLYAAGFVVLAELAYEGLARGVAWVEPELVARRVLLLAGLAVGSVALGAVVLAVATIPLRGGVVLTAVGVAAATLALALIARLARRDL